MADWLNLPKNVTRHCDYCGVVFTYNEKELPKFGGCCSNGCLAAFVERRLRKLETVLRIKVSVGGLNE